jgi:HEAT repeat protein
VLIVDLVLIVFLLLYKIIRKNQEDRYRKFEKTLQDEFEYSMVNLTPSEFAKRYKNSSQRKYIYRLMISIASQKEYDFHGIFDEMGFTDEEMAKVAKTSDLQSLKDLSIIKSPRSYLLLLSLLKSDLPEVSYRSGYAIASLKITPEQQMEVVKSLLDSSIVTQKAIEIVDLMNPPLEDFFPLLQEQESDRGKLILLSYLHHKLIDHSSQTKFFQKQLLLQAERVCNVVKPFLNESEEVTIATIKVLGNTKHHNALILLIDLYYRKPSSNITAAIAQELDKFPWEETIEPLKEMAQDRNYWVRLNAYETLSNQGENGKKAILEISKTSPYPSTNFLVYQLLSQNENLTDEFARYKQELEADAS